MLIGIFLFTIFSIFIRPFGLKIWIYSSIGALFVVVFKFINLQSLEFLFSLIWDSSLTLISLIIICFCLESLGFFDRLIFILLNFSKVRHNLKKHTQTSQKHSNIYIVRTHKMLLLLFLSASFTSVMFANDGAILIFTPIVVLIFTKLKKPNNRLFIAILCAICFICDASSNAFVISNLTNIITANYFNIGFLDFAKIMALPNIFVVCGIIALFMLIFKKIMPKFLYIYLPKTPTMPNTSFFLHCFILWLFVASFFIAEILHLPFSFPSVLFALIFILLLLKNDKKQCIFVLKNAPYGIIIFSFGLFIVVYGLYQNELSTLLKLFLNKYTNDTNITFFDMLNVAGFSAICSSIFNNLPMVFVGDLSLNEYFNTRIFKDNLAQQANINQQLKEILIFAHLLGCNIGSKLTTIGSLCTLLWIEILAKKGIKISIKQYYTFSIIFALPILFLGLLGLWIYMVFL